MSTTPPVGGSVAFYPAPRRIGADSRGVLPGWGCEPALREAALNTFGLEQERRVSLRGWLALERLKDTFGLHDACIVVFGAERGSQIHDSLVMAGEGA